MGPAGRLAFGGIIPPKRPTHAAAKIHEVRRVARHTDIATTMKHYTDENLKDLGALADRLGAVG